MTAGKLVPPYPVARCQASNCDHQLLTEETEAYLHKNAENGKLLTLCGQCSMLAQLHASLRFPLIPL